MKNLKIDGIKRMLGKKDYQVSSDDKNCIINDESGSLASTGSKKVTITSKK